MLAIPKQPVTLQTLKKRAQIGRISDINYLMRDIDTKVNKFGSTIILYVLYCIVSHEGRARVAHFLFNGNRMQRNYAALCLTQWGYRDIVDIAIEEKKIHSL